MAAAVAPAPSGLQKVGGELSNINAWLRAQVSKYRTHSESLRDFFSSFQSSKRGPKKYIEQLRDVSNGTSEVLNISLDDIQKYFEDTDASLAIILEFNAQRYLRILADAAEAVRKQHFPDARYRAERASGIAKSMESANVPVHLRLPYEIHLTPLTQEGGQLRTVLTARELNASHIGALVTIEGVVAKVSAVKPRLQVAFYRCLDCGAEVHQPVNAGSFMPLSHCTSPACALNQRKGELKMSLPESKFVRHQKVKLQEPSSRVPFGSVPRLQTLYVEGSLTRVMTPGMSVVVTGILLPVPRTNSSALGAKTDAGSLVIETAFHVQDVQEQTSAMTISDEQISAEPRAGAEPEDAVVKELREQFKSLQQDPFLYEKLAQALAPSVHGMTDVKKVLLLQLVSGSSESFEDGMQIRGDIHVLLLGDPGVAKSQLLRQICAIAPRSYYTTGKGSSGVGLTASVVRDPLSGDFTLEGGAIVLSDRGICCIDEFDKMEEADRTTIHEVMEQQTVSISKAGITATLNARTSILAAANPQYGRYDVTKTPMQNINLPAALLSRFDVQFLLLDRPGRDTDTKLAEHVLKVYQGEKVDSQSTAPLIHPQVIRCLIAKAKTFSPKVPPHVGREMVEYYVDQRQQEREHLRAERQRASTRPDNQQDLLSIFSYTTPRTLLAVLRLAQGVARLRFSNTVDRGDFEEALRLIAESRRSVSPSEHEHESDGEDEPRRPSRQRRGDVQGEILDILRDISASHKVRDKDWNGWMAINEVEDLATRLGFTSEQVHAAIETYEELDVLQWKSNNRREVRFVE